ncbi:MAG: phosphoglucomutase/phosphomannomutase family protein [Clostridia bacterium]|nr:phosphoglucomutase/phosphomannomutase family protein [Clostridia bacterium]
MIRFGTGGWRAEIARDFTEENIRLVAQGLAQYAIREGKADKPIVVGRDRRFLSDKAALWISETLAANGLKVLYIARSAPTPLVMHTVMKQELHFGIEVTASHNPSEYNGIKVIVDEGRDAPLEVTDELEKIISTCTPKYMSFRAAKDEGLIEEFVNPFNDFVDDILSVLDTDVIRKRGPRILFDSMHGSSTYPLLTIFYTTRCTPDSVHGNRDTLFGGMMPAPTEKTLLDLSLDVVKNGYDLGIGIDGDGDRLGIIDRDGRYISANEILVLLYYYLHEYKGWKGPVVRNLATTHMLDRIAADLGETCYEVPVGFKWISSKIDEVDAILGGESSGGLTVRGHIHGKDSIYAASLFVEMICATGKTPGEMIDELYRKYGTFCLEECNLRYPAPARAAIDEKIMVKKLLPDFGAPIRKVSYEDGCKVYFEDDSFIICRFSGTEPILRIFSEAADSKTALGYIDAFHSFLADELAE